MIVGYGTTVPDGSLPVYSVIDEHEARDLLVLACPVNRFGDFVAPELAREQTLENLDKFAERLDKAHELIKKNGHCRCQL